MIRTLLIIIAIKRVEERDKTEETKVKHNTVTPHLLTDAQPRPVQQSVASGQLPQFVNWAGLSVLWNVFGQFRSAVLAILPPGSLCTYSWHSMRHLQKQGRHKAQGHVHSHSNPLGQTTNIFLSFLFSLEAI